MRAWIENQYGEEVLELIVEDDDEFHLPNNPESMFPAFLCDGDTFTVKTDR